MTRMRYGWMQLTYMRSVSFWGKFTSGSRISASRSDLLKVPKNCPFAPQASICSHVPKSSSQKGCMNLSLNGVFSKYTANSEFPTPLELCPFSTTSAIHLFKNSTRLCSRTGKKTSSKLLVSKAPKSDSNNKMSYIVLS